MAAPAVMALSPNRSFELAFRIFRHNTRQIAMIGIVGNIRFDKTRAFDRRIDQAVGVKPQGQPLQRVRQIAAGPTVHAGAQNTAIDVHLFPSE